jgi:hypothetical protein
MAALQAARPSRVKARKHASTSEQEKNLAYLSGRREYALPRKGSF